MSGNVGLLRDKGNPFPSPRGSRKGTVIVIIVRGVLSVFMQVHEGFGRKRCQQWAASETEVSKEFFFFTLPLALPNHGGQVY